jgi:hypothetical protein
LVEHIDKETIQGWEGLNKTYSTDVSCGLKRSITSNGNKDKSSSQSIRAKIFRAGFPLSL